MLPTKKECELCGVSFAPSRFGPKPSRFCSKKCTDRDYYLANKEKIRAQTAKYQKEHPEQKRSYNRRHKQKIRKDAERVIQMREASRRSYAKRTQADPDRWKRRFKEDPEFRKKILARAKLRYHVKKGHIQKKPCEGCGSNSAEAHHSDYDKPLEVEWLCHACHGVQHRKEKDN